MFDSSRKIIENTSLVDRHKKCVWRTRYSPFDGIRLIINLVRHCFSATKRKNVAQLGIDNMFSTPDQYGKGGSSNTLAAKPLFIGGNPIQKRNGASSRYLGCIRNVEIVNLSEKLSFKRFPTLMVQGNVTLSSCPTI